MRPRPSREAVGRLAGRLSMSDFDVQHRDCFDSLAAMRDAGGVDLILTSQPYPDARKPEAYGPSLIRRWRATGGWATRCSRRSSPAACVR